MTARTGVKNLPLLRVVGLVFGFAFSLVGALGVRQGLQSQAWPRADGRVVISERVGVGTHGLGRVVARYRLGADLRDCGALHAGVSASASDLGVYPLGKRVRVGYDPVDPARCLIAPGLSLGSLTFLVTGLVFLGVAFVVDRRLRAGAA